MFKLSSHSHYQTSFEPLIQNIIIDCSKWKALVLVIHFVASIKTFVPLIFISYLEFSSTILLQVKFNMFYEIT